MKTETKVTHTPTPWYTEAVNTQVGHCWKIQPIGACIYVDNQRLPHEAENQPSVEARANAAFIVRAVNAHEELLSRLNMCLHYFGADMQNSFRISVKEAIAKAEAA